MKKYLLVTGNLVDVFGRDNIKRRNIPFDMKKCNQLIDINTHLLLVTDEEKAKEYGEVLTEEEAVIKYAELQEGNEKVRELI